MLSINVLSWYLKNLLICYYEHLVHIIMQVQVSNQNILQRRGHSAAPLAISPECVEVVLFDGQQKVGGSCIADTTALRFGKVFS